MAPLNSGRNTPEIAGDLRQGDVAAATLIHAGAMVMRNAAGLLTKGQTALNLIGAGRAEKSADNTLGLAGDLSVTFKRGTFRFANSAAGDLIAEADIGALCFAVDDQTVAKTDGGGTRSRAGIIDGVDNAGVWVRFDEALTRNL